MSRSDKKCIRLCLDGHPEAFQELVGRYQGSVLSYLSAKLGDEARAEKGAQEVLVRSYFGLKRLKEPESFSSWLLDIASRVVREQQGRAEPKRRMANPVVLKCFPVRLTAIHKSNVRV